MTVGAFRAHPSILSPHPDHHLHDHIATGAMDYGETRIGHGLRVVSEYAHVAAGVQSQMHPETFVVARRAEHINTRMQRCGMDGEWFLRAENMSVPLSLASPFPAGHRQWLSSE